MEQQKITNIDLYNKQKELLDTLLKTGAITKAQHDFSLKGLNDKMKLSENDIKK